MLENTCVGRWSRGSEPGRRRSHSPSMVKEGFYYSRSKDHRGVRVTGTRSLVQQYKVCDRLIRWFCQGSTFRGLCEFFPSAVTEKNPSTTGAGNRFVPLRQLEHTKMLIMSYTSPEDVIWTGVLVGDLETHYQRSTFRGLRCTTPPISRSPLFSRRSCDSNLGWGERGDPEEMGLCILVHFLS